MSDHESERLRKEAYGMMLQGRFNDALAGYDRAIEVAESDAQRELVTIVKADAMIATDLDGPEVRALPAIVMRRRSPRHVYFAAYTLMRRFSETDRRRALFYGDIARNAATELDDPSACVKVLNGVGVIQMIDSQFAEATVTFGQAVALLDDGRTDELRAQFRPGVVANLGGAKVLNDEIADGIGLIHTVYEELDDPNARADSALDLCYGYLELGKYDQAQHYGEEAFALATIDRLIRNSHYLLGEIAVRTDDFETAERHFAVLQSFYPDFPNLRHLLLAVDLCPILNLKC